MNKTFKVSVIMGVIFAICMFENPAGITFSILVLAAVIALAGLTAGCKCGFEFTDILYATACIVLGISVVFTQDKGFHFLTKVGILTLMIIYLIKKFYGIKNLGMYRGIVAIFNFFVGMIANIGAPFMELDMGKGNTEEGNNSSNRNLILLGIVIALPILLIVLSLLTSADAVFRRVLLNMFDSLDDIRSICKAITYLFLGFFASYGIAKTAYDKKLNMAEPSFKRYNPVVAITVLVILSFVYVVFSVIQIVTLFGKGTSFLPKGYTYSEYAREGFFQLVIVAFINMVIIFVCRAMFEKNTILKVILTIVSLCTFVMIASSAYRLKMYIDMYHLTFSRIIGMFALGALALYMVGLTIAIFNDRFPIFEYSLAITTIVYMGIVLIRPDVLIAKENVNYIKEREDVRYLVNNLSYDAAPYLTNIRGYEDILEDYYEDILEECNSKDIRKFNISEYKAYNAAKEYLGEERVSSEFTSNK